MLYFNRIDISQEIDVNKASASKECDVCYYILNFLNYSSTFQPNVCNRYHDCFISLITISEAIKLLQNADLPQKSGKL